MNIGMVVTNFRTEGGIERAAVELSNHLALLDHDITVYSSSFTATHHHAITCIPTAAWKLSTTTTLASFHLMSRCALINNMHDVVHAHATLLNTCDVLTLQSCHRAGMEIRKRFDSKNANVKNWRIADKYRLYMERTYLQRGRYKKIIAVSQGLKREIREYYNVPEGDIVVIPNGVNLDEFTPTTPAQKSRIRKQLGIPENMFVLLFVANEFERKGLACVLESLTHMSKEEIILLVVGKDAPSPYLARAKQLGIEQKVKFAGVHHHVASYYQASDAFVMPTYHESFLMAGIEAAACGLPLLITRVPGVEDYLKDSVNGFFIERSPDSVASGVKKLLHNTNLQHQMSVGATRTAQSYSWDTIVRQTLNVYEEVLNNKRARAVS